MNQENNFEHDKLTDEEKEEARNNGFILLGKTGNGKTTLLNALFNKVMGLVAKSAESVTLKPKVYYYKLSNGKVATLIDTPGLGDSKKINQENIDENHLQEIIKVISDERIHLKGILFLVHFQHARFDGDDKAVLLNYNKIFPLKDFWRKVVIIYTHFFADPNENENEEELIEQRNNLNENTFEEMMEKASNVSDVISYNELKKRYFNSYSDANNEIKRKLNNKNRKELEIILDELMNSGPLFHKVEIQHLQNHKWKDENGKEFIGEVEIIKFFDFNENPIKERMNIIRKEEVRKDVYYSPPSYSSSYYDAKFDDNGYLKYQVTPAPMPVVNNTPLIISSLLATIVVAATVVSAPVDNGVNALGYEIGYLFGKLFS